MLIDTHAHLNIDPLYGRWRAEVAKAYNVGVGAIIIPGTDIETSKRAIEISKTDHRLIASVGIHPENIDVDLDQLVSLGHSVGVAAIGEIGLDYFRFPKGSDLEKQKIKQRQLFMEQLQLARELNLPVIVHMRTDEAMNDAVRDIKSVFGTNQFRGIFHCFTGSYEFFEEIMGWDVYVGVGGMITYDRQLQLQRVVSQIPLERIVLETDAPLLMPQPFQKGINTPGNVTISACKLSQLKAVPLLDILEITGKNASRLFPQLKTL